MPLGLVSLNAMLTGLSQLATHASVHTGYPSTAGLLEASGGSPAYARRPVTWTAPTTGVLVAAAPVNFNLPAGTFTYIGIWGALTAGTFYGFSPINGGSLHGTGYTDNTTDTITSPAHGLVNGDKIVVSALPGVSLPTGLDASLTYTVSGVNPDYFELDNGGHVFIDSDAPVNWQRLAPLTFTENGRLTVNTLSFTLGT